MIARVRRGQELDELVLYATSGHAIHVVVYGLGPDEGRRNCETLIGWLAASGIPLDDADEGRRP